MAILLPVSQGAERVGATHSTMGASGTSKAIGILPNRKLPSRRMAHPLSPGKDASRNIDLLGLESEGQLLSVDGKRRRSCDSYRTARVTSDIF